MKELCERLLGRPLQPADGIDVTRLSAAEQRLGMPLPSALRDLYLHAGRAKCLMESFQRFAAPEQLEIDDGKLVFLEENQGVCFWGASWEKVVEHNGLHIYWQSGVLIWWLEESNGMVDCVLLSALTRVSYERYEAEHVLADL